MPGPALAISRLRVVRGGREVLHDISLDVAPGTVTGLLGPSGCGKSTLMRAVVGVQIVAAGEVRVLGRAAGSPELRRRVGYVTQAPSVYSDLSVAENLRYFAAVVDAGPDRIAEVIDTVGLGCSPSSRPRSCASSDSPSSAWTRRTGPGWSACWRWPTPCSAWRWACC